MALVLSQLAVRRVTAPDYPDTWWDVRLDLPWAFAAELQTAVNDKGVMAAAGIVVRAMVKAWNIEAEPGVVASITDEVVGQLPTQLVTFMLTDKDHGLMNFLVQPSQTPKAN